MAAALASLPQLGEHPGGPLAQGRLSGGQVGVAIRAIQAGVVQRTSDTRR